MSVPTDPICRLRTSSAGMVTGPREYDVKAALLFRCLELVHFPTNTTPARQDSLTLGILGKNPFGESLESLVGKSISRRKLLLKKISNRKAAESCDLVFICSSEKKRIGKVLMDLEGLPLLTVGETPGFADEGGILNLLLDGRNIRLEINLGAAERARIGFDPQLLKVVPLENAPPDSPPTNSAHL